MTERETTAPRTSRGSRADNPVDVVKVEPGPGGVMLELDADNVVIGFYEPDEEATAPIRTAPVPPGKGYADLYGETWDKLRIARLALKRVADIAEGSTTANSLPHLARIAREALRDA